VVHTVALILARLLPPTIHPMVVHFPIALTYLAAATELLGAVTGRRRDRFLDRASWWLLTLALVALVVAAVAGVVSEQSVRWDPSMARLLSRHQHWAELTGLLALGAWAVRWLTPYAPRAGEAWTALGTGRGRPTLASLLLLVGAAAAITVTGSLGGSLVYGHGAGVRGVTLLRHP
jgi:uncharacterized membrane protein